MDNEGGLSNQPGARQSAFIDAYAGENGAVDADARQAERQRSPENRATTYPKSGLRPTRSSRVAAVVAGRRAL